MNSDQELAVNEDESLDQLVFGHHSKVTPLRYRVNQVKMCAAIADEVSRQCPGMICEQAQFNAIIQAANVICCAINGDQHE